MHVDTDLCEDLCTCLASKFSFTRALSGRAHSQSPVLHQLAGLPAAGAHVGSEVRARGCSRAALLLHVPLTLLRALRWLEQQPRGRGLLADGACITVHCLGARLMVRDSASGAVGEQ